MRAKVSGVAIGADYPEDARAKRRDFIRSGNATSAVAAERLIERFAILQEGAEW